MSLLKVSAQLDRSDNGTPWGFRLTGGKDFKAALVIQKVNPGSLSERCGLKEGDIIHEIGGYSAEHLSHKDAQQLIMSQGNSLNLKLERESGYGSTPQPMYQAVQPSNHFSNTPINAYNITPTPFGGYNKPVSSPLPVNYGNPSTQEEEVSKETRDSSRDADALITASTNNIQFAINNNTTTSPSVALKSPTNTIPSPTSIVDTTTITSYFSTSPTLTTATTNTINLTCSDKGTFLMGSVAETPTTHVTASNLDVISNTSSSFKSLLLNRNDNPSNHNDSNNKCLDGNGSYNNNNETNGDNNNTNNKIKNENKINNNNNINNNINNNDKETNNKANNNNGTYNNNNNNDITNKINNNTNANDSDKTNSRLVIRRPSQSRSFMRIQHSLDESMDSVDTDSSASSSLVTLCAPSNQIKTNSNVKDDVVSTETKLSKPIPPKPTYKPKYIPPVPQKPKTTHTPQQDTSNECVLKTKSNQDNNKNDNTRITNNIYNGINNDNNNNNISTINNNTSIDNNNNNNDNNKNNKMSKGAKMFMNKLQNSDIDGGNNDNKNINNKKTKMNNNNMVDINKCNIEEAQTKTDLTIQNVHESKIRDSEVVRKEEASNDEVRNVSNADRRSFKNYFESKQSVSQQADQSISQLSPHSVDVVESSERKQLVIKPRPSQQKSQLHTTSTNHSPTPQQPPTSTPQQPPTLTPPQLPTTSPPTQIQQQQTQNDTNATEVQQVVELGDRKQIVIKKTSQTQQVNNNIPNSEEIHEATERKQILIKTKSLKTSTPHQQNTQASHQQQTQQQTPQQQTPQQQTPQQQTQLSSPNNDVLMQSADRKQILIKPKALPRTTQTPPRQQPQDHNDFDVHGPATAAPMQQEIASWAPQMPSGERKIKLGKAGEAETRAAVVGGSRIPVCATCHTSIRGPFVAALDKTWCPDHFVCSNPSCKQLLMGAGFVEERGELFCVNDFEKYLAPKCAQCSLPIVGEVLTALKSTYHVGCFSCSACHKPIGTGRFHTEGGQIYCEQDWTSMFGNVCYGCKFPIEDNERWVEALSQTWHPRCFNCSSCQINLDGKSFCNKAGKPYCKKHGSARGF